MKISKIINEAYKIKGLFSASEMREVYPEIKKLKENSLLVEIGSYYGRSAAFFSLTNPKIRILSIDREVVMDQSVLKLGNVTQILSGSAQVSKSFGWPIDFLFIDGNHSPEGVKKDIDAWTKFVKIGGFVLFHDYSKIEYPGLVKTIDKWLANSDFKMIRIFPKQLLAKRKK